MSTRTTSLGVAAALAAIAVAIPTAVQAYADPTPTTTTSAAPTTSEMPAPSLIELPDPQGSGCDAYKKRIPTGAGSFASMGREPASAAIAANPDLSTFSAAISGGLNPAVNIVSVLDGGPYMVFAPTNEAFAKLDPATLDQLKSDPAALTSTLYYHMVLGYLGPDDVHGKMATQQGSPIEVTGKGNDIKINDTAKLVCGYTARDAYVYMIDTVLSPTDAPQPTDVSGTSTTSATPTTSTTPTTTTSASPSEAEAPTTSQVPG